MYDIRVKLSKVYRLELQIVFQKPQRPVLDPVLNPCVLDPGRPTHRVCKDL